VDGQPKSGQKMPISVVTGDHSNLCLTLQYNF